MQDEIGTEAEALAARSIAQRGVQLVATAHGAELARLIKNPTLSDLIGGIQACASSRPSPAFPSSPMYSMTSQEVSPKWAACCCGTLFLCIPFSRLFGAASDPVQPQYMPCCHDTFCGHG